MTKECVCDGCGKKIKKKSRYCLRIELFAAPEVEFDAEDLAQDHKQSIADICRHAKDMDAKKLEEDVYICYDLILCKHCRDRFAQRVKLKEFV